MNNARSLCLMCFLLGASLMLVVCTFAPPVRSHVEAREVSGLHHVSAAFPADVHPHGTIEAIQIPLAHPDGVFADGEERLRQPRWIFHGLSETELTRFLGSCVVEVDEASLLFDKAQWEVSSNACVISPRRHLLWKLNPVARHQIYSLLARNPDNYSQ